MITYNKQNREFIATDNFNEKLERERIISLKGGGITQTGGAITQATTYEYKIDKPK